MKTARCRRSGGLAEAPELALLGRDDVVGTEPRPLHPDQVLDALLAERRPVGDEARGGLEAVRRGEDERDPQVCAGEARRRDLAADPRQVDRDEPHLLRGDRVDVVQPLVALDPDDAAGLDAGLADLGGDVRERPTDRDGDHRLDVVRDDRGALERQVVRARALLFAAGLLELDELGELALRDPLGDVDAEGLGEIELGAGGHRHGVASNCVDGAVEKKLPLSLDDDWIIG